MATVEQLQTLDIVERTTSGLSLVGTAFIISTFAMSPEFHKPINRLVFYASFGNIISNIATLISTSGPAAGSTSSLCQFQAFVIQMFLPADALWALAMAWNVYLTFFRKYNPSQLRAMERTYFVLCYGIPALPAIIFLGLRTQKLGLVYGNAVLWCWIAKPWDVLRVAAFYGPIWLVMLTTFAIYIMAGLEIYQKRKELMNFTYPTNRVVSPVVENPFTSTKTTEVQITREDILPIRPRSPSIELEISKPDPIQSNGSEGYPQYSITIESNGEGNYAAKTPATRQSRVTTVAETNRAAWGYARCAFFFFCVMLITWIPSSANRVYSLVHPEVFNYPLNFIASFVLPLQGFWNAVIYMMTSFPACRSLWYRLVGRLPTTRRHSLPTHHGPRHSHPPYPLHQKRRTTSLCGKIGVLNDAKPPSANASRRSSTSHIDPRDSSQHELASCTGQC